MAAVARTWHRSVSWRSSFGFAVALGALSLTTILSPAVARAAAPQAILDNHAPSLDSADGGKHTVSIGLSNLTSGVLSVTPTPTDPADSGCDPTFDKSAELPPAEHTDLTLTVPAGCPISDSGFHFRLTVGTGPSATTYDPVVAAPKPDPAPDWTGSLIAFPIALGILFLIMTWLLVLWRPLFWLRHRHTKIKVKRKAARELRLEDVDSLKVSAPLPGLPSTYNFKDSWVSNITAIVAVFTGVFASSDVVKVFLGDNADSSLALATVGAAVALAFTGAGPIVVLSTRKAEGDSITVGGLLGGSMFTLAGAFGGLWVTYEAVRKLDFAGLEDVAIPVALGFTGLLLAVYGYRTLVSTLEQGIAPPKEEPSETTLAANKIAKAIRDAAKGKPPEPEKAGPAKEILSAPAEVIMSALKPGVVDATEEIEPGIDKPPVPAGTAPGPRRSALL